MIGALKKFLMERSILSITPSNIRDVDPGGQSEGVDRHDRRYERQVAASTLAIVILYQKALVAAQAGGASLFCGGCRQK